MSIQQLNSPNVTATSTDNELSGMCTIPSCHGNLAVITSGLFFDGTLNNRENANGLNPGISYENDHSNISRSFEYYTGTLNGDDNKNLVIYVEGTGSVNHDPDQLIDAAFGTGDTGIRARVKEGMYRLVDVILQEIDSSVDSLEITLDVFGFSRGAANARHFLHLNSKPIEKSSRMAENSKTYLNCIEYLLNKKLTKNSSSSNSSTNEIKITTMTWRFAGLYETVSSHGIIHSNDVRELGLKISVPIQKVLQLVAQDEYRSQFSLTTINSAGSRGQTIAMPGVHSDIGGGYVDESAEEERTVYRYKSRNRKQAEDKVESVKDWFLEQGWYKEQVGSNKDKLKAELRTRRDNSKKPPRTEYTYSLKAARESVKNTYSHIPLHIMTEIAIDEGLPFNLESIKKKYPIPLSEDIYQKIKNEEPLNASYLKKIRYEYLHWSSYYNIANTPRFNQRDNTKYERCIFDG